MAKVKLDQLIKNLEKIKKNLVAKQLLNKAMAEQCIDIIYKRTKSGYGLDKSGRGKEKLKPLSKSYKDYRQGKAYYFQKNGRLFRVPNTSNKLTQYGLGPYFSPNRSNLTMTGSMLESLSYSFSARGIKIFVAKSSRPDSNLTNAEVAELVAKNGRPFLGLHDGEVLIIRRELVKIVRKLLQIV